ncbi:hypothetical protein [Xenorhabdus anantnagensis]|uniref:Uncharacterized protein n=1 Tax=Xenorhabdus anantnagensis TaxID=3025875 RepID=A0ABT5LQ06_9GAMM|nr:hypothetical protein [Xenorhabdus anantnagensis]MDC9595836.1 hypothetical protein [Xenorhabdus anantnagensis]
MKKVEFDFDQSPDLDTFYGKFNVYFELEDKEEMEGELQFNVLG